MHFCCRLCACSGNTVNNWLSHQYHVVQALDYKHRILDALPDKAKFEPLMTCYLTNSTSPDEVYEAKKNGIVAYKLYPAGATTNSNSGVTDFKKLIPTLKAMADVSTASRHTHQTCHGNATFHSLQLSEITLSRAVCCMS